MVYICVICMSRVSLKPLSDEYRGLLESLVSTAVNLVDLHDLVLLSCGTCLLLIKTLDSFKKTAITGVKHLLCLSLMQKNQIEIEQVLIKEEPPGKVNSLVQLVPETEQRSSVNTSQNWVKSETCPQNEPQGSEVKGKCDCIEDLIPANTINVLDTNEGEIINAEDSGPALLVPKSEKTTVFTHTASQSESVTQTPTINTAAYPRIQVVPQNMLMDTQYSRFSSPPQFLPNNYCPSNDTALNGSTPRILMVPQNMLMNTQYPRFSSPQYLPNNYYTSNDTALNESTHPRIHMVPQNMFMNTQYSHFSSPPQFLPNNYFTSNDTALNGSTNPTPTQSQNGRKTGTSALKNVASKSKVSNRVTPLSLEERDSRPGDCNPIIIAEEFIKPRWYTRVFPNREMHFWRRKECTRKEFVEAPYKCSSCVLLFGSREEMDAHAKEHVSTPGKFPCKVCALSILPSEEDAHTTKHTKRLQCARCVFNTEHLAVIEAHDCSSQPAKKLRIRKKIENPVICEICRSKYANEAALNSHKERMHKNQAFHCDICNMEFNCKKKLYFHKSYKHKIKVNSILEAVRPELYCSDCNAMFSSPSQYRAHRMTLKHTTRDSWKYECDLCKKKFPDKMNVARHISIIHQMEKAKVCKVCGETIVNPSYFRQHMKKHAPKPAAARPHVCHLCGNAFTIAKSLNEHMLKHSGLRPYKCPLCPATFTYSAALYTHNRLKHLKIKNKLKKTSKKDGKKKKVEDEKVQEAETAQEPES